MDELSSISRNNSSQAYFVKGQPTEAWYGYKFAGVDPATGHTLAYIDAKDNQGNPMGHLTADGRYVIDMDSEFSTKAVSFLGEAYPPISGCHSAFPFRPNQLLQSNSPPTAYRL